MTGIRGRDGAFAEYLTLPTTNLHLVPDEVTDDSAVFVEPLAAALRTVEQVPVRSSDTAVVFGVGRLGQLCCRVLAATGARVFGVGRTPRGLKWLPLGVTGTTDAASLPPADLAVDCTGSAEGLALAARAVRPGGTVILKTTHAGRGARLPPQVVIDELTVVGSRCGPFAPALRMLATGDIDPRHLITGRYSLHDARMALRAAAEPDHLKVVIQSSP